MSLIIDFANIILHLDKYLTTLIHDYGILIYLILFLVVFCETGLIFFPFLPGDSLLFAAGAVASQGSMNIWLLYLVLIAAAIFGDTLNYFIGRNVGMKLFAKVKYLKHEHLDKTHKFFDKYGGKTIILARFLPIVRTLAPFVAGIGRMRYLRFLTYNVLGGIIWISVFLLGGYFFGNISFVKNNFTLVLMMIIIVSLIIPIIEYIRHKKQLKNEKTLQI